MYPWQQAARRVDASESQLFYKKTISNHRCDEVGDEEKEANPRRNAVSDVNSSPQTCQRTAHDAMTQIQVDPLHLRSSSWQSFFFSSTGIAPISRKRRFFSVNADLMSVT